LPLQPAPQPPGPPHGCCPHCPLHATALPAATDPRLFRTLEEIATTLGRIERMIEEDED